MPLDPQCAALLKIATSSEEPPTMSAELLREGSHATAGMMNPSEDVAAITDFEVPGSSGGIRARAYSPEPGAVLPILLYFHGGGWTAADIDQTDPIARALANRCHSVVVAVDYRKAPEDPFPAGLNDCFAVTEWVAKNGAELGGDAERIVVLGDSAGGNIAASVALMARDHGAPRIALQVLVYPALDTSLGYESWRTLGDGSYMLSSDAMVWLWANYVQDADPTDPYVAPMQAVDFSGVAPAWIATPEFDPLRDEGARYADRLRENGVDADLRVYDGMIHGILWMGSVIDGGLRLLDDVGEVVRGAFVSSNVSARSV